MSNCVETSEDVWGFVTGSQNPSNPVCLFWDWVWLGPWWCVSFNFSSLFLALILSAVRLIRFNSISLKCPLIVSAPAVIHEQCLMMCFYYQLYFSLTRQQYFSILACSNALILCPSGLRARLCLMMSTTTAQLRRGLCLVYDFWLGHCDRPKYHTRDFRWKASKG